MKQIDRLRNMTTNEMAKYLDNVSNFRTRICKICIAHEYCRNNFDDSKTCKQTIKDFLESEVDTCESNKT